jgi:hypothetical protein
MALFKIKIWEKHRVVKFEEDQLDYAFFPHPKDDMWHKFTYAIEVDRIRIIAIEEFVLFDDENNAVPCVLIYFSDGAFVYGRYPTVAAFEKPYNKEYLPLVPRNLAEIVGDLKGEEETSKEEPEDQED